MADPSLLDPVAFGIPDKWLRTENEDDERGSEAKESIAKLVNKAEGEEIAKRREKLKVVAEKGKNAVGLALSGGGIRSATFCLGFIQVLAARNFLKRVDFLSTVSGGGYTGCFLTTRLGKGDDSEEVGNPHGPDSDAVAYVRQRAKYLAASDVWERWSMLTGTVAGLFLNWTAPLFFLATLSLSAIFLTDWFNVLRQRDQFEPWQILNGAFLAVAVVLTIGYAIRIRFYGDAGWLKIPLGLAFLLLLVALAGWALQAGFYYFANSLTPAGATAGGGANFSRWLGGTLTLSSLFGAMPVLMRVLPFFKEPKQREFILKICLYALGLLVPLTAILVFYALCFIGVVGKDQFSWWHFDRHGPSLLLWAIWAASGLISLFLLNVNLTSPHRLYRDQLAATFIATDDGDQQPKPLEQINSEGQAPYHLINATANLPSSEAAALRDRKCDFFLFSKHWCGSPASGYRKTQQWIINNGKKIDTATAMAVSGAAVAPRMGLGSLPVLSALLSILNLRLSFWILNRPADSRWSVLDPVRAPGFSCLMREMFGLGMDEKRRWLNLSDGGHIENLGVYELLRRRCKFIVCVDGEADPDRSFSGLVTLIRHAQIDFGVRIIADLEALKKLRKDSEGVSQANAALFQVYYPDQQRPGKSDIGLMLYVKLATTGAEPALVNQYRLKNPEFPHQSTLDQFFDQEQFEVYRQLGVFVAEGVMRADDQGPLDADAASHWFGKLADRMLAPGQAGYLGT